MDQGKLSQPDALLHLARGTALAFGALMDKAREAAGTLLASKGSFRNWQFAGMLGVSRQRASVLLKRLVDSEELKRRGRGRGANYERGPGWGLGPWGFSRGTYQDSVWALIAEELPAFGYIALTATGRTQFRTRKEAREILDSMWSGFLTVLDFRGITRITPAFAEEILCIGCVYVSAMVEPINMSPEVETVIKFVRARDDRSFRPVPEKRRSG